MKRTNGIEAVHLLEKSAGAKVKFVHVVRNPFDNIATMVLRKRTIKERYGDHELKVRYKNGIIYYTLIYFRQGNV